MLALIILSLASLCVGQHIVPVAASASFPGCGLSCPNLLAAQSLCIPPTAPTANAQTYVTCFCSSNYLVPLRTSPDGVCDAQCTIESDRQLIQNWFNAGCANGGVNFVAAANAAGTAAAPTTLQTSAGTSTGSALATASPTPTSTTSPANGSRSWISTHWHWVMMVAILTVAFILLAVLGVCLKRLHRRRVEARRAEASGFPVDREKAGSRASTANLESLFGPAQHMAQTNGWEYTHEQDRQMSGGRAPGAATRGESRRVKRHHSSRSEGKQRANVAEDAPVLEKKRSNRTSSRTISQRHRKGEGDAPKGRDAEKQLRSVNSTEPK